MFPMWRLVISAATVGSADVAGVPTMNSCPTRCSRVMRASTALAPPLGTGTQATASKPVATRTTTAEEARRVPAGLHRRNIFTTAT